MRLSNRCSWFLTLTSAPSFSKSSVMSAWFSITASISGVFPSCQSNHNKARLDCINYLTFQCARQSLSVYKDALLAQPMVWVSILVYIMQYALSRKLVVHYFCNLALRKLNISSWCIRQLLCVVNTVIIWSLTVKIHLVLCVDVGWVLQELQHHR